MQLPLYSTLESVFPCPLILRGFSQNLKFKTPLFGKVGLDSSGRHFYILSYKKTENILPSHGAIWRRNYYHFKKFEEFEVSHFAELAKKIKSFSMLVNFFSFLSLVIQL